MPKDFLPTAEQLTCGSERTRDEYIQRRWPGASAALIHALRHAYMTGVVDTLKAVKEMEDEALRRSEGGQTH